MKRRMITVNVLTPNGDSIIMRFSFNGTLKDVETYFLNRIFNVGDDIQKGYLNPKLEAKLMNITRSFIEGK